MPGLSCGSAYLTVVWFLSGSLYPASAQIWTDEVLGVQYGHLESNVTLACGKSQIRTPVVWHLNGSAALPWHRVTSDGTLALLRADASAQGVYSCYDNQGLHLHSVRLRLGRSPGLLSVSCRVPNHNHVRCSWVESVKTFLPAQYNASLRGNGHEWRPCVLDVARKHCDMDQPSFWQTIHTLRITESNALGTETTFARFKLHELLKPDPPEAVMASAVEGYAKRLSVSWNPPSSWPLEEAFPLAFQIRYRPLGSNHWSEICSEKSPKVIFDALAGHPHQVQIRARDELNAESQWSEWSPQLLVQPWEAFSTPDPTEDLPPEEKIPTYFVPFGTKPETATEKTHGPEVEGNLGLVILLVLFSVFLLIIVPSLVYVVWVRHRRRGHVTKQELTSMVKMKSMPI